MKQRADEVVPRNANEATVLGFYTTLMKKDFEAFADLWADDAVQEIPFAQELPNFEDVWNGKERILSYYVKALPGRKDHVFWIHEIHQTTDPNVIIVEASAHSIVVANGRSYDQRYVFIFKLRDGKIVLGREYVNPLNFMKAFGD
ncbi:nuclear transport factor 2 family protein [Pseudochelatococcus sp. B33]